MIIFKKSVLMCAFLIISGASAEAATFQGLGNLPGGSFYSRAFGVSADGKTVVGISSSVNGSEAFVWDEANKMRGLNDLPGGDFSSWAYAVSADGTAVVGIGTSSVGWQPMIWTSGSGMQGIGNSSGRATGISADGKTVVGKFNSGQAFVYTNGQIRNLGDLPGGVTTTDAVSISADGKTIAGTGSSWKGTEAFIWTENDGMRGLGDLPGGAFQSRTYGMSSDGAAVVGSSTEGNDDGHAFLWTNVSGMIGLGCLSGGSSYSCAYAASAGGKRVVGVSNSSEGQEAFIWDAGNKMRSLRKVLTAGGADLTGWTLSSALGISSDGQTIVGYGWSPQGMEAWVARLDPVPEPSSVIALLSGLGGLAVFYKRRTV